MGANKGLTVKELADFASTLVKNGLGDKHVLITTDDEGNGYHTLFYQFTTDPEGIKECAEAGMFHDSNDPKEVVLLG